MIELMQMVEHVHRDTRGGLYSCAMSAAAGAKGSRFAAAVEFFDRLPWYLRKRGVKNAAAVARLIARKIKAPSFCPGTEGWGLARMDGATPPVFSLYTGKTWWARSHGGICRVHPSRIFFARGLN